MTTSLNLAIFDESSSGYNLEHVTSVYFNAKMSKMSIILTSNVNIHVADLVKREHEQISTTSVQDGRETGIDCNNTLY